MIRSIVVGTLFLAVSAVSRAQTPGDSVPAAPRYAATADALTRYIESEMADKSLPALSIAIVDGDNVVWGTSSGSSVQVYLPITGDVADEFSWQALFHPPSVLDAGYDVLVPFYRQWFIPFNPPTMSALPPSDIMVNQTTAGGL